MVEVEESNIEAGYNNNISSRRYTETNIENSKETYKQQRQRRKREKRQSQRADKKNNKNATEENRQYDNEEKTWGDEPTIDPDWMENNKSGKLRILHMNTNGIASRNGYIEWEILLDNMDQIQADIFCFNETKIDTKQGQVQFDIRDRGKKVDRHLSLNMNSSNQSPATPKSIFKPGGTMIGTRGN